MVNHSCGVAIGLGKSMGGQKYIKQAWTPPAGLRGRSGAIRLKSRRFDVALAVLYYPPPTILVEKRAMWMKTFDTSPHVHILHWHGLELADRVSRQ